MSDASIWAPGGAVLAASNNSIAVEQLSPTASSQSLFLLTNFTYVVGTNSLHIYLNGVLQRNGTDYVETSESSFTWLSPAFVVGTDTITAEGLTEVISSPANPFGTVREVQVATAGQTSFTIASSAYVPYNGSLQVYINGLRQEVLDAYSEIAGAVVFTEALAAGDEVTFQFNSEIGIGQEAAYVSFLPAGTGAAPTNVQTKLRESVSVKDFGAVGDGIADDTAAIQAAIDFFYLNSSGQKIARKGIYFPKGTYVVTATLNVTNTRQAGTSSKDSMRLFGDTTWGSAIIGSPGRNNAIIDCSGSQNFTIENMQIAGVQNNAGVGIFSGSSTVLPQSHTQRFLNVWVSLPSDSLANSGNGTVGFWNYGSEENFHAGCHYEADTGAIFTGNSSLPFVYTESIVTLSASHSCGVNILDSVSLFSNRASNGLALYTADVNTFTLSGYLTGGSQTGICHKLQGSFTGSIVATYENNLEAISLLGTINHSNFVLSVQAGETINNGALIAMSPGSNIINSDLEILNLGAAKQLIKLSGVSVNVPVTSIIRHSTIKTNVTKDYLYNTDTSPAGNGLAYLLANSRDAHFYVSDGEYHLDDTGHRTTVRGLQWSAAGGTTNADVVLATFDITPIGVANLKALGGVIEFNGIVANSGSGTNASFAARLLVTLPFYTNYTDGAIVVGTGVQVADSIISRIPGATLITGALLIGSVSGSVLTVTLRVTKSGADFTGFRASGNVLLLNPNSTIGGFTIKPS